MKLKFPIYYGKDLLGMNWYRNKHFHENNKVKKWFSGLVFLEVNKCRLQNAKLSSVTIHYTIYLQNTRTDGGNVRSVIEKFLLDGLTKYGVLNDDTVKCIIGDSAEYFVDKLNPRCEIEIVKSLTGWRQPHICLKNIF